MLAIPILLQRLVFKDKCIILKLSINLSTHFAELAEKIFSKNPTIDALNAANVA
jgi:hypothetical protein